jgi:hypothetical protein
MAQHQSVQDTVPESGLHSFRDRRNERNLLATMKKINFTRQTEGAQKQWKHASSVHLFQPERRKIDQKIGST